jgi:enoyl-CoA hydratase
MDVLRTLTYEVTGRVARITLNRPRRANAITLDMPSELAAAVERANLDPSVHVILLSGNGDGFCGGYDLEGFADRRRDPGGAARADGSPLDPDVVYSNHDPSRPWDPTVDLAMMSRNVRGFMSLFHGEKPVVCKVHGYCVGGGTDLALCSDLLIIEDVAKIGYPPARVWGSPTTALWVFRIGPEKAKRLLFTGDSLSGTEAVAWGLATEAPSREDLDDRTEALLERIARLPVNQLVMMKLLVNQTLVLQGLPVLQTLGTLFDGAAPSHARGVRFRPADGGGGIPSGGPRAGRAVRRRRPLDLPGLRARSGLTAADAGRTVGRRTEDPMASENRLATGLDRRDFARRLAWGGAAALLARRGDAASGPSLPDTPASPDEAFWSTVRGQFLIPRDVAALNAANLCPSPAPVVEAVSNDRDLDHDLSPANRARLHGDAKETARALLAEFLRVTPEEILITRNTSESNNLVSSGLDLKAGDEVLAFADNHPSHLRAWQEKAKRWGFTLRVVDRIQPHPGPERYLGAFAGQISSRTRVLAFTHLTNTVGDLFPAAELCRMARERGVLSAVDGAQSFGLMDLDLGAMGPDFFSGSGHKWLCGPKETGVLYVRRDVQDRLWPSVYSLYGGATPLAKRLEALGQRDEPAILGLGEAVRFQKRIGQRAIEQRALELARALRQGLARLDGVTVWTPAASDRSHAIVAFQPGGLDPERLASALFERDRIVCAVRSGADRPGLRFAPHFYNSHAEVERAVAAVERSLSSGL